MIPTRIDFLPDPENGVIWLIADGKKVAAAPPEQARGLATKLLLTCDIGYPIAAYYHQLTEKRQAVEEVERILRLP